MSDDQADRDGLIAAARYIRDALIRRSPGPKSRAKWRINRTADGVSLTNSDMGAYMTETNKRHPVFPKGPRKSWSWADENIHHPERTHWASRGILSAATEAEEKFRDAWLERIAADSPFFELD